MLEVAVNTCGVGISVTVKTDNAENNYNLIITFFAVSGFDKSGECIYADLCNINIITIAVVVSTCIDTPRGAAPVLALPIFSLGLEN